MALLPASVTKLATLLRTANYACMLEQLTMLACQQLLMRGNTMDNRDNKCLFIPFCGTGFRNIAVVIQNMKI